VASSRPPLLASVGLGWDDSAQACLLRRLLSCLVAPPPWNPPPPPSSARPSLSSLGGRYGKGPQAAAAHRATRGTRSSALPCGARPSSLGPPPSPLTCGRPSPCGARPSSLGPPPSPLSSEGNMPPALPPLLETFNCMHSRDREANMLLPPLVGLSLNKNPLNLRTPRANSERLPTTCNILFISATHGMARLLIAMVRLPLCPQFAFGSPRFAFALRVPLGQPQRAVTRPPRHFLAELDVREMQREKQLLLSPTRVDT
jgi:hypothetical protein